MNDAGLPSYAELRFQDGIECARRATQHDQTGQLSVAITYYREAIQALNDAASMDSQYAGFQDRCQEYHRRASELQHYLNSGGGKGVRTLLRLTVHVSVAKRRHVYYRWLGKHHPEVYFQIERSRL